MSIVFDDFIREVTALCPGIKSIWLMGSRANNSMRPDSDWDLIAFADENVLKVLEKHTLIHKRCVDFLVVTNGDDFKNAWGDRAKTGSLKSWEWNQISSDKAEYLSAKWIESDEQSKIELKKLVAIKAWPK